MSLKVQLGTIRVAMSEIITAADHSSDVLHEVRVLTFSDVRLLTRQRIQ
jgi:hypothetical protein